MSNTNGYSCLFTPYVSVQLDADNEVTDVKVDWSDTFVNVWTTDAEGSDSEELWHNGMQGEEPAAGKAACAYLDADDMRKRVLTALQPTKPVVVVTRHPDSEDQISLHGVEAEVVYIDLGSSFDCTPNDEEQARDWAEGFVRQARELPEGHPAREEILGIVAATIEGYGLDEWWAEVTA
jgi:hypothetical protein